MELDELATERARRALSSVFDEYGVPGHTEGELHHFGFGGLVGRVEILRGSRATAAHAHMTVSGPLLAAPVLDCWVGLGEGPAAAVDDAIRQWAGGAYHAYHDAFAHDHPPTYELVLDGTCWYVFEAPLICRGGSSEQLDAICDRAPLRSLLTSSELRLSPYRAHRVRWVAGAAYEFLVDDELSHELSDRLRAFDWPGPLPTLLRHSAVLLPRDLAETRGTFNASVEDAESSLRMAGGLVDASRRATVLSALQHGLELQPTHPKAPRLCLRWAELELERTPSPATQPFDVPLSRAMLHAYAAMAAGSPQTALHWLRRTSTRSVNLEATCAAHVQSLANLYAEHALPDRPESLVQTALRARSSGDAPVRAAISSIEAPSAVAAVRSLYPRLEVSYAAIPDPDPRLPLSPHATVVWTYRPPGLWSALRRRLGTEARPLQPAPSPHVAARVAAIAARSYSRTGWQVPAQEVAAELRDHHVRDLLGVMVHPPEMNGLEPWSARFVVMCASAFVLARMAEATGWKSAPCRALVGLLDGPCDWTVTASVIALVDWALRVPDAEADIRDVLIERLDAPLNPIRFMCFYEPTSWLLLRLPSLPDDVRERLVRDVLAA